MFLRRVTITGFKSFANKTVIELERGVTAVVGPNGSGKSNIADAVRWALGEQGKSRLRLEGRDEVVFAGNDKRARASFAEVILLFDNEDGAFPLDLTEVELSRRLYRSGETDYRLAGRSVRLGDIQSLLAQAGVGASTYAVIGQGMIDSMLMSSPAERKLLFDEAAGIRGPELGREAARRKLAATASNLTRLRDISAELAPRLGTLEAAVSAADERAALQDRVTSLRAAVAGAEAAHWTAAQSAAQSELGRLSVAAHRLRHERLALEHTWARHQLIESQTAARREGLRQHLAGLEQSRDQAAADLALAKAAVAEAARADQAAADLTARSKAAASDVKAAESRLDELQAELKSNSEAGARAKAAVDKATREVAAAQAALVAIRDGTTGGSRDQYLDHALQVLKALALGLDTPEFTEQQVRLHVHKAGRLLSHAVGSGAAELLHELKTAQKHLESAMLKRETIVEHQTNVSIAGHSLEIDIAYQAAEVVRLTDWEKQLADELEPYKSAARHTPELNKAEARAEAALEAATRELDSGRSQLAGLSQSPGDAQDGARLIAGLEKAKSDLAAVISTQKVAHASLREAKTNLTHASHRAAGWGVSSAPKASDQPLAALTDQLARAETSLTERAQIYEDQLVQYNEATQRQTELATQIADLEAAEADLTHLVSELDTLIRARFKENFQALAEQFSSYFTRLFDGGKASLELTETEDGYGINIKASPAGKRLTAITALSGGERALAGVALVAAIMRVNPSPFVVLDEIDAALDEANSGRLAGILTEISQYSQAIVITHNRQTMEAAQVLFGVTMNEHHISHLISLRLEQAAELAAR